MTNTHESSDVAAPPEGCPVQHGAVRLEEQRFQEDTAELYRQLRAEHGTVVPVVLEGDVPAWFVIGYREVHEVLSNSQLFARDSRRWNAWDRVPDDWPLMPFVGYQPSLLFKEGDEHQRRAGAVSDALNATDRFELGREAERISDGLVDTFLGDGRADLMEQYAHQMPLYVMANLFGLPDAKAGGLVRDMTLTIAGGPEAGEAHGRIQDTMQWLVATKRERPGPDFPSRMLAHDAALTEEELLQDLIVVITAAQQPLAYWIGNTLRLMLTDNYFAVNLHGGRRSVGQAMNEALWEDTPTANYIGRWATRPTQLGGQHIQTGDLVVFSLAAANTDPQVRPDSYKDSVGNNAYLSFSYGEHRCPWPGPELAQVIAKTAVEVLLDRIPDVNLSVAPDELKWLPSVWMRGLAALPVEFSPV